MRARPILALDPAGLGPSCSHKYLARHSISLPTDAEV